jgi:hypothetical protein
VPASPANPPHLLTCGDTNRYTPTPPQSLSSPSRSTPTNRTFVVLDGPTPTSASTRNRGSMAPAARSAPRHRRLPAAPAPPTTAPPLPVLAGEMHCPSFVSFAGGMCRASPTSVHRRGAPPVVCLPHGLPRRDVPPSWPPLPPPFVGAMRRPTHTGVPVGLVCPRVMGTGTTSCP